MYSVKFNAGKLKNLRFGGSGKQIRDFVMREVDGSDEEVAANLSKAKGGASTSAEELVRMAIVEVNGEPVKQPYLAFDTWNTRARAFALAAFKSINSAGQEEVDDFLAAALPFDGDPTPGTAGGAASGTD